MTYDNPTTLIDIAFQKIKDLIMYRDFAQYYFTSDQVIKKAYNILNYTGLYKDYIKTWTCCTRADRTWANLKDHVCTVCQGEERYDT